MTAFRTGSRRFSVAPRRERRRGLRHDDARRLVALLPSRSGTSTGKRWSRSTTELRPLGLPGDGSWAMRRSSIIEGANAVDALCRLAFDAVAWKAEQG